MDIAKNLVQSFAPFKKVLDTYPSGIELMYEQGKGYFLKVDLLLLERYQELADLAVPQ